MRLVYNAIVLTLLILPNIADADSVMLLGDDVTWSSSLSTPLPYLIKVKSDDSSDEMWAWQLKLQVVRSAGATGTLEFNAAMKPPAYLFGDDSYGIFPTSFEASDTTEPINDLTFQGVLVPSAWTNLLIVELVASSNASGRFDILALPGEYDGSAWFGSDLASGAFVNVPFGEGAVAVGSVTIGSAVPEPSSFSLFAAAGGGLLVLILSAGCRGKVTASQNCGTLVAARPDPRHDGSVCTVLEGRRDLQ
jgi:hypothetical protein